MRFADKYGFYELNPFPGCNQLVVSNHAFIYPIYRGRGRGQWQHEQRLAKAKELGYNLIVCTVNKNNEAEKHILRKNGWWLGPEFDNTETGNTVEFWWRNL